MFGERINTKNILEKFSDVSKKVFKNNLVSYEVQLRAYCFPWSIA